MTLLTRSRTAAVVAAMGVSFFATSLMAQPATPQPNSGKSPAAAAATSSKPETVEQRITTLHKELQITPAEEAKWAPVAQAMRDNAAAMDKLAMSKHRDAPEVTTAVEDLKTYQEFAQAQVNGLKNLTSAFEDLYNAMPAPQKKIADTAFDKYGR